MSTCLHKGTWREGYFFTHFLARCPLAWGCVPKLSNFQYYYFLQLPWGLDALERNTIDIYARHRAHRQVIFEVSKDLAFNSNKHVSKDIHEIDLGTTILCVEHLCTTSITTIGTTGLQMIQLRLLPTCCFICVVIANQKSVKLCNVWCTKFEIHN